MIRDVDRITHLLTAIADAKESIAGLTMEQFLESKDKRVAAERYILIVGEASHMVSNELKARHPEIPWQEIRLFCKIGHGIPCPICCMKQHSPSTTGCKHANDRPLWAFDGPGAVFTCSQPCAARFGSTRCEQAA